MQLGWNLPLCLLAAGRADLQGVLCRLPSLEEGKEPHLATEVHSRGPRLAPFLSPLTGSLCVNHLQFLRISEYNRCKGCVGKVQKYLQKSRVFFLKAFLKEKENVVTIYYS